MAAEQDDLTAAIADFKARRVEKNQRRAGRFTPSEMLGTVLEQLDKETSDAQQIIKVLSQILPQTKGK